MRSALSRGCRTAAGQPTPDVRSRPNGFANVRSPSSLRTLRAGAATISSEPPRRPPCPRARAEAAQSSRRRPTRRAHRLDGNGRHAPRCRQRHRRARGEPIRRHSARDAGRCVRRDLRHHTADRTGGDNGWTGRVGRGRADRCLRTRPGCARRSTSLPGGKPGRDGRRSDAATRPSPSTQPCGAPA